MGRALRLLQMKYVSWQARAICQLVVELTLEIQRDTSNVEQAVSSAISSVNDGVKIIGHADDSFKEIVMLLI